MSVMIIDYGMGNLKSVKRAFEECGASVFVSDDPKDLKEASHIVLPGVGSFADAMKYIREKNWIEEIKKAVSEDGIPLLGICLGMQLLASKGYENGENDGLGLIKGEVKRFIPVSEEVRIPHVGWNEIEKQQEDPLLNEIPNGTDFYFVHSYYFVADDEKDVLAKTPYNGGFSSIVRNGNVMGTQFHPEKSQKYGFQLIKNFLEVS